MAIYEISAKWHRDHDKDFEALEELVLKIMDLLDEANHPIVFHKYTGMVAYPNSCGALCGGNDVKIELSDELAEIVRNVAQPENMHLADLERYTIGINADALRHYENKKQLRKLQK